MLDSGHKYVNPKLKKKDPPVRQRQEDAASANEQPESHGHSCLLLCSKHSEGKVCVSSDTNIPEGGATRGRSGSLNTRTIPVAGATGGLGWFPVWFPFMSQFPSGNLSVFLILNLPLMSLS
ncbi:hypothetical protein QTO34_012619 [Cnephaeus nilssonii]|uniref:Uncharacterized protein n=1 Tax=Cnephaeus nilssonii TaxID=3371016 RepID=A0AA40HBK8_CNENI|nr:hypothetical protein QTO34_012619 [Eptesicus nilssonii]